MFASVCIYLVTCLLSMLSGIALLRLARCPLQRTDQVLMAPVVSLLPCILIPALGIYLFDLPLRRTAPLVLMSVLLLALAGLRGLVSVIRPHLFPLVACLGLPLLVLAPAFLAGLDNASIARHGSDIPLYLICAREYWQMGPSSVDPSLGPSYYFAHVIAPDWRHGGSTLLALLSCMYHVGDAQYALGLLIAFVLFASACASTTFAAAFAPDLQPIGWAFMATLFTCSSWLSSIYLGGYLDHLVAMPVMLTLLTQGRSGLQAPLLFGALTSLLGYVYPEFLIVLPLCLVAARGRVRTERRVVAWAAVAALLLCPLYPLLKKLTMLRVMQITEHYWRFNSLHFLGLTRASTFLSTWWTMREDDGQAPTSSIFLALVLTAFLLLGLWKRVKMGDGLSALVLAPLALASMAAGLFLHWGYLSYKLVTLCAPGICLLLVAACLGWPSAIQRSGAVALLIGCLYLSGMNHSLHVPQPPWWQYRALRSVPGLVDSPAVLLAVGNWFDTAIAAYLLRSLPIYNALPCGYPLESTVVDLNKVTYLVTDADTLPDVGGAVWPRPIFRNSIYAVWKLVPSWRLIVLSQDAAQMSILARADCLAHLQGRRSDSQTATLVIRVVGSKFPPTTWHLSNSAFDVEVALTRGINAVHLEASPAADLHVISATAVGSNK